MGYKSGLVSIIVVLLSLILTINQNHPLITRTTNQTQTLLYKTYDQTHSMLRSLSRKMAAQTISNSAINTTANASKYSSVALLSREVVKKVYAIETPEGDGATVRRSIGTPQLRNFSPFLMLDHFKLDPSKPGGFPDHPHRGQTTVTYMLDGYFQHEDFMGHSGKIGPGDLQWMIAGRGVMHAEMPLLRDENGNKLPAPDGLQLWVDLPEKHKMDEASYQEYSKDKVPLALPRPDQPEETEGKGWKVKVISGQSHGVESPVRTPDRGGCWYFDVTLEHPGARIFQEIPTGYNSFIYTFGAAKVRVGDQSTPTGQKEYEQYNTLVLSNKAQVTDPKVDPSTVPQENGVWIEHAGEEGQEARFVVIAGEPLDQRVFQHGPFVMTSREEIMQTMMDFQSGKNGFERAPGWRSKIGNRM